MGTCVLGVLQQASPCVLPSITARGIHISQMTMSSNMIAKLFVVLLMAAAAAAITAELANCLTECDDKYANDVDDCNNKYLGCRGILGREIDAGCDQDVVREFWDACLTEVNKCLDDADTADEICVGVCWHKSEN